MPNLELELEQIALDESVGVTESFVAGCDEAGRGSFAGPLVAAAVILPLDVNLPEINDSKKINKKHHRKFAEQILNQAVAVGVGVATVEYIDRFGIDTANKHAIEEAIKNLSVTPTRLLIDGTEQHAVSTTIPQIQIIEGDSKSLSIASASIIAKSVHDTLMKEYAEEFPEYGWITNTGYGTQKHMQAIREHGICKHHRQSFKPIKEYLKQQTRGTA